MTYDWLTLRVTNRGPLPVLLTKVVADSVVNKS